MPRGRIEPRLAAAGLPPTVSFGVLSAVVMIVVAFGLQSTMHHRIESRARADAVDSTRFVTRIAIEPVLRGRDLSAGELPVQVRNRLDAVVRDGVDKGVLQRIKIFDVTSRLVYSDNARQLGRQTPESPELRSGLAGRSTSKFADIVDGDHQDEGDVGLLLEVYVPLQLGDRPDGVVELYVPYALNQAAVREQSRQLLALLVGALSLLWLTLMAIVATVSGRLRDELSRNRYQALHDALTGLPSRVLFFDRLERATAASRRRGTIAAVLVLDLDGFKDVNDSYGHAVGDLLLQQVAQRLPVGMRDSDTVARLGGDEFAAVLSDLTDLPAIDRVAASFMAAFSEPFLLGCAELRVMPSVGVAVQGRDGDEPDELLRKADAAMYAAKRAGGGLAHYDPDRDDATTRLLALAEMREAIEQGQLRLHYQPSVRLHDSIVTGAEALVRWEHPTRGLLPPSEFVPLAEQSELIAPLTAWVIDAAARQCRAWLDDDLDMCVAVNLSARHVVDERLPALVRAALERHALPAYRIVFEITETALINRPDDARRVLAELSALGVNIAIDDFGTGYATLSWLQHLPFNALKIDRSFVADVMTGGPGLELVRYTTQLAHAMGKAVVAEGVESAAQYRALGQLGCDHAQGFWIGRPMPDGEFRSWLAGWRAQVQDGTSCSSPVVLTVH